ncbi:MULTISPECIES: poly(R)-hydroxyalkanoic acid synthase subunit PhaE [Dyella]|uniref:Poly(3-hydroxyalkanoate) polymerase subunit PhaE n=2 Tax=Dyella TaxID=231454 RepID=A0A4R0YUT1_9GAMM|nr:MULTISPECIES: poly(R)-hydroxyalkanoic acid synthase subunit PhaE [Dyella]TBR39220.1 pha synthase subunit protein [Dyella terrae]TCI13193.1 pha synthase subunit protein [Dyella soli]
MTDQAGDFLKQYQSMVQQSWDHWMQTMQPGMRGAMPHATHAQGDDLLERMMHGLKGYSDWLQSAATSGVVGTSPDDWQASLRQLFTGTNPPFAQAFGGIDSSAAQGFAQQWQNWLQAMQAPNIPDMSQLGDMPAFGYTRERQMQHQALLNAMREYLETYSRYQSLLARANAEGFELLQQKLAQQDGAARPVESLKALYDQWVDAVEDAYGEIALSDEFRQAYGAMVNAQMHVRKLQQEQLEALCRELGMPTRSEVSSLGKRVQELRRELRANQSQAMADAVRDKDIAALRAELAALKRQSSPRTETAPAKKTTTRREDVALDSDAKRTRKTAAARRTTTTSAARGTPRKRK